MYLGHRLRSGVAWRIREGGGLWCSAGGGGVHVDGPLRGRGRRKHAHLFSHGEYICSQRGVYGWVEDVSRYIEIDVGSSSFDIHLIWMFSSFLDD